MLSIERHLDRAGTMPESVLPQRPQRHALMVRIALFAGVPLIAMLAGAPLLGAGFQAEDFGWLALARHLQTPWVLFYEDVAFTYFYRPIGLLFWQLCGELGGANPGIHNLLDLLLQAADATLVGLVAARLARKRGIGVLAGALFACLPAASGTALWASDRFDPVCLFFGLLALLAFERMLERPRMWAWATISLLLCLTAKEVGFAVAAAMLALLGWRAWIRREWPPRLWLAVAAPIAVALAMHVLIVHSIDASLDSSQSWRALWRGVSYWWLRFPAAVFGFRAAHAWAWLLLMVAALLVLGGIAHAVRRRRDEVLRLALVGAALLATPAWLQWPVTQLVLGSPAALDFTVNLRFYYLAFAGFAVLWSAGYAGLHDTRAQWLLAAASLVLATYWFAGSHRIARDWADDTRASTASYLTLGQALGSRTFPAGCRIELSAPDMPPEFTHFADVIVKGAAPSGASVLGCSVFAGEAPYLSIVDAQLCNDAAWPGLTVRRVRNLPLLEPIGNLCMMSFDPPHFTPDEPGVLRFAVDASGRIRPLQ